MRSGHINNISNCVNCAVIGASGYTGAELIRLLLNHPKLNITALAGDKSAGKKIGEIFPHLGQYSLPMVQRVQTIDYKNIDVVFLALPHGASHKIVNIITERKPDIVIIDLSADFRLTDLKNYNLWYNQEHQAPQLQQHAVYGLSEIYRSDIAKARIIACPGCYPTAILLALLPLIKAQIIAIDDIIIDAKSGISGAGRNVAITSLFCENGEYISPYKVNGHRHMAELSQEISRAAGNGQNQPQISFTPHLIPMSRGELVTCYLKLRAEADVEQARQALVSAYSDEHFVTVLDANQIPVTQMVRASNHCVMNLFADAIPTRIKLISVIDNLVKGASGQAIQNCNIRFGFDETSGLKQVALFP